MFDFILFCICFGVFAYKLLRLLSKIRKHQSIKREYEIDVIDLTDEPPAKKSRLSNLTVNRVLIEENYDLTIDEQNNEPIDVDDGSDFDDFEDWIVEHMSDSALDEIEHFSQDLLRYLNECENLSDSSRDSDVILVEQEIDVISVSSASSASIISVSSSSSVEYMGRTSPYATGKYNINKSFYVYVLFLSIAKENYMRVYVYECMFVCYLLYFVYVIV